jgi:arylsulfatase A-like enzyme
VLVVSLDGLDARYLLKRDEYGLKIPTLRRLMSEGVWARGVVSVYPSVTYPAHTTLVTGAVPSRHGIYGNEVFAPPPAPQLERAAWHWMARDIKVDTLWTAAARAGLKSGMVSWPVSSGAGDYNVPEVWKAGTSPSDSLQQTLAEITAQARPRGLVEEIQRRDPEIYRNVNADEGDDMRTRWASYIIEEKRPELMLVHLFDLDHLQHDFGPFSPEAFSILEKSDAYVARLLSAYERAGTLRETAVFIVSDHGFMPVSRHVQPNVILQRAGLLSLREEKNAQGKPYTVVADWRALAYPTSGSCSIILRDPKDGDAYRRALEAFRPYAGRIDASPTRETGHVLRVIYAEDLRKMGSNPRAAFALEGLNGHSFGNRLTGEPVIDARQRGNHGFLPTLPGYRTFLIASGASVARRGDLGNVHMLDIAPTIARTLGLKLRGADGRPIKAVSGKL